MAKVSLRIYNREIERLIEQGSVDEAIAHCRHILKTFPKHLETYRLLGKAYLESRRYNEATDVFGRLLMAVPDDFVAHVGLGIIRDEENKLDDAIWHMERASEVQSANPAVQSELQRLYGRRDGVEPPKIRMSRGALARIYAQGELYPQAIAEVRSVLRDDPQRADMQLLLAFCYFRSGQKSDASDLCNQLLKRYPYCFDANRIMVELLPTTAGATESTQVYRTRVSELDPYSNFVKGSVFQSAEVTDASVNLDKLEYSGDAQSLDQDWGSTLGIELGSPPALAASSSADQPDWLRSSGFDEGSPPIPAGEPGSDAASGDDIPDFLRAAGWNESSGPEQPASIFDNEPAGDGELVPADLPDWLKGQMPEAGHSESATDSRAGSESITTPDWLKDLDALGQPSGQYGASPPAESTDAPDWLQDLAGATPPASPIETPQAEIAQPAEIPDWLQGMEAKSEPETAAPIESLGASAQEQEDAVAWLESLAAKHGAKPEELVTDPGKRSETPPEWVQQAQSLANEPPAHASIQDLGASAQEQEDAVAWLESLAAKHGAKPEELVTDPDKRSETPPEWVQQAQVLGESQTDGEPIVPERSVEEQFLAEFEEASKPAPGADETGMWLNTLGQKAKTGAAPASEPEDLPDWIKPAAEEQTLERGEIPEWLSDAQQPADSGRQFEFSEKESAQETPSGLPDWLSSLETADENESAPAEDVMRSQDLSNWLSSLDDEPGLDLDPELLRASQRPPFPQPSAATEKSDSSDWFSDSASEEEEIPWGTASAPTEEPVSSPDAPPVTLTADLPDWLKGVDEAVEETAEGEDLPPWLHRERWESAPQQPKPTSPSDWRPVAEEPAQTISEKPRRPADTPPSPEPREAPVAEKKKSPAKPPARQRKSETGQGGVGMLNQAKAELERGDIPEALLHYGKLIKKGKYLEEIVSHLSESLYRYPVEVGIWQALGDAYMRANRLKEALDAYNKAEELIR